MRSERGERIHLREMKQVAKKDVLSIRTIVAVGIGSALFVILGRFG